MTNARRMVLMVPLMLCAWAPAAPAVTIVTEFIGGAPPANAAGAGNIVDIVQAAARIWESAYADSFTVRIHYGWAPLDSAGTHTLLEQGGAPNRELVGLILFDNSGAVPFYLDPTPEANEEYRRLTKEYQDLGGGFVNVARLFSHPTGEAAGRVDLLTVALHEIGHALGMCNANLSYLDGSRPGVLVIADRLPFAGTAIPLAVNGAGVTSHIDAARVTYGAVMAGVCGDERRLPSGLDILANAQISGFEILTLDAEPAASARPADVRSARPGTALRGDRR